jgi:adenylate kinase
MRIYASYPISRTRDFPEKRKEIDEHRSNLHKRFIVFDPVSIDERLLRFKYEKWQQSHQRPKRLDLSREDRWPVPSEHFNYNLLSDGIEYPEIIEGIDPAEVNEIVFSQLGSADVDGQIVWRDYHLIDQAHCVAAYRPSYEGDYASGVNAEILYASLVGDTHTYQYVPIEDGSSHPFQHTGTATTDYNQFLNLLESHQRQLQEDRTRPSHKSQLAGIPCPP